MQTLIKTYIRNKDTKQPRGVAVAVKTDNGVLYGYSLCHSTKDKWNKKLGTEIALARAYSDGYNLPMCAPTEKLVLDAFEHLQARCVKYFQDLPLEDIVITDQLELENVRI